MTPPPTPDYEACLHSLEELVAAVKRSAQGAQDADGHPLLSAEEATGRLVGLATYAEGIEQDMPTRPPAPSPPTVPSPSSAPELEPAAGDTHTIPPGRGWGNP